MSKNPEAFLHDANSRNDEKLLKLRAKFGIEGYGFYYLLLEMLLQADNSELELEYSYLAFALSMDIQKVELILTYMIELGLFVVEGKKFFSSGLKDRVEAFEKKRAIWADNGSKGGRPPKQITKDIRGLNQTKTKQKPNNNQDETKSTNININTINNDNVNIKSNTKNKGKLVIGTLPQVWDFPEARSALEAWIQYRIEIKKPITQSTLTGLIKKYDPLLFIESVEFTIEKGWIGLREPDKNTTNPPKSCFVPFVKQTNFDRNMDILSESLERLHGSRDNLKKIN